MTLVLRVLGLERLENGELASLKLDRHGVRIGRSAHMDWCLPDPQNHISSSHCEIQYLDGSYVLVDRSTNGTYVNGQPERLAGPYRLADGDVLTIGRYEILARLDGEARAADRPGSANPDASWAGWDSHLAAGPAGVAPAEWDRPAPQAAISGMGPASGAWAPPAIEAASQPASVWSQPEAPPLPVSSWSSEPVGPSAPSASDIWGRLAETNSVDWERSGFQAPPVSAPAPVASPKTLEGWGEVAAEPPPARAAEPVAPAPPRPSAVGEWTAFLAAAGLEEGQVRASRGEVMAATGALLRRLVGGLVVMMEARARAKAQLGAEGTAFSFEGNNPLKFARAPDQAMLQLLHPPERGFMAADRAVEDAFQDLQAHQLATLAAMQGALAATLARFSPSSIRQRAEMRGLLAKILPAARDATLWQAYEREFEGVIKGSDEAFMDVFAKEFREAYERAAADMKAKR